MTTTVIFTTLQENRNNRRIWLQGVSLAEAGINPGDLYKRTEKPGEIVLEIIPDGNRKVSRKKIGGLIVPVIDIENAMVAEIFPFEVGTQLRVICRDGKIIIRLHPDVAAKKEREARILDRFKTRKPLSFGYFFEDAPLTTALTEGLMKFGHESYVQFGVSLTDDPHQSHVKIPVNFHDSDYPVIHRSLGDLLASINGLPKKEPVEFMYAGDPSIHSDVDDQVSPFFFKLRAIEAANPAIVMFEVADSETVHPLLTVAIQILTQLGYVIQNRTLDTDQGKRLCVLGVSEGLNKHDWTQLLQVPAVVKTYDVKLNNRKNDYSEERDFYRTFRIQESLFREETLSTLSGFHGGGILANAIHTGLASEGIQSAISVGIELEDKYLSSSLTNNKAIWSDDAYILQGSIACSRPSSAMPPMALAELGVPCTGASRSGISKNKLTCAEEHSAAGSMFYWALRHYEASDVAIGVLENVQEYIKTVSMKVINDTLKVLGYTVSLRVLSGMEFGSFEDRVRMCCLAVTNSLSDYFDLDSLVPVRKREQTLGEILEDIPEGDPLWKTYDYLAAKEQRDIEAGKGFRRQLLDASSTKSGTAGKGYAKSRGTEPFVVADFNPKLSRLFTVVEHSLVKTIPFSLVNNLSSTCAHEILGQSVIHCKFVSVAKMIGQGLRSLREELQNSDDFKAYMADLTFAPDFGRDAA